MAKIGNISVQNVDSSTVPTNREESKISDDKRTYSHLEVPKLEKSLQVQSQESNPTVKTSNLGLNEMDHLEKNIFSNIPNNSAQMRTSNEINYVVIKGFESKHEFTATTNDFNNRLKETTIIAGLGSKDSSMATTTGPSISQTQIKNKDENPVIDSETAPKEVIVNLAKNITNVEIELRKEDVDTLVHIFFDPQNPSKLTINPITQNHPNYQEYEKSGKIGAMKKNGDYDFSDKQQELFRGKVVRDAKGQIIDASKFKFHDHHKFNVFLEDARKHLESERAREAAAKEATTTTSTSSKEVLTAIAARGPPINFTAKHVEFSRGTTSPEVVLFKTLILQLILSAIRAGRQKEAERKAEEAKKKVVKDEISRQEGRIDIRKGEQSKREISSTNVKRTGRQQEYIKGMTNTRAIRYDSNREAIRKELEVEETVAVAQHIAPKAEKSVWDSKSVFHLIPAKGPVSPALFKRAHYPIESGRLKAISFAGLY